MPRSPESADSGSAAATAERPVRTSPVPLWLRVVVLVIFGALFANELWEAIANLITFQQFAFAFGGAVSVRGWVVIALTLIVPIVGFIAALRFSRGCRPLGYILTFLAALAACSTVTLSLYSLS